MMQFRNQLLAILLCFGGISLALADSQGELQQRLQRISHFSADFIQTVINQDSQELQQSKGKLWLQRPSLFRWKIDSPDEMLIISDGSTLWMYLPDLQQVTATCLHQALDNTPWVLISSNQPENWKHYLIKQQGDRFTITPRQDSHPLQQLTITVTLQGVIQQLIFAERQGSINQILLKNHRHHRIPAHQFIFKCPPGVMVDDQR